MSSDPPIRSAQNALVKRARAVRAGKLPGLVLLESARLVAEARRAGLLFEFVLVTPGVLARHEALLAGIDSVRTVEPRVLDGTSALDTAPGLLAVAHRPSERTLAELELGSDGLALAVAGIADPGNLGALARSAEAAGARALVVVCGGARPFGDKALRGSMGSLLRLPVYEVNSIEAGRSIAARHVVAAMEGTPHTRFDFAGRLVLWTSGEVGARDASFDGMERVTIPMAGAVESLNVTVAASLLLFAAGRVPAP